MQSKQNPKKRREKAGLTQQELAQKAGISLSTVTKCEGANRWPVHSRVLTAYRRALGLPVTR